MSDPIPIYVVANGELVEAAFNAVVTVLGNATFETAIKISVLFSIIGAAAYYIRGRDLAILARWFITYFAITMILLAPKVKVQIFDSSNPGSGHFLANVPYGLAYPANLITSIAHNLTVVFDEAFHTPDEFAYNKTGMLFGSKLFRLSTELNVEDSTIKQELNEYVKNCVLGDILINNKYSIEDLADSSNLLDTITKDTSHIRGIYVAEKNGNNTTKMKFKTCREAVSTIKSHIEKDAKVSIFKKFISHVFKKSVQDPPKKISEETLVQEVYKYFDYGALSNSALNIVTQNLLINGIRDEILNYTAESGATAALLNLSTTQAMERMRLSFATSRNIATYTIPIMHTVLLILMISLFPVVILLAFQPALSGQVIKNYFYTLIWLESWPLMFAALNMMTNFYVKAKTAGIGGAGLTMSNIDQLALEHSDVANMAGYLMLSIPFISVGLVKGMSSAFNTAASYIGGVLQSSASSAASEVASGNLHLGNSSWNNVNANKLDTNSTLMRNTATEQLQSGMLRTTMADGNTSYDSSHVLSKLPVNIKMSDIVSGIQSDQAESARMASINDQKTYDQSVSNAISDFDSFSKNRGISKSTGETFNNRETASAAHAAEEMWNLATSVAKNQNISVSDAFKGLTNLNPTSGLC